MLRKICNRCGRPMNINEKCECNKGNRRENYKIYNEQYRDRVKQTFYESEAWKRVREAAKARAGGIDEYVMKYEGRIERGKIAHHIEEISESPEQSLDLKNIVYVSERTHNQVHAAYKVGGKRAREMRERLGKIRGE